MRHTYLGRIRAGAGATPELLNSVGQAFLRFTESAQQYPGLEAATFARNVTLTLETANLLLQLHSDVYSDDIFPHTLATVLAHRDQFVNEPPSLYNYDCGPDNILLRDERFTRFVDLEGCYQGTLSLHFGAFFERLAQADGPGYDAPKVVAHFWSMFCQMLPSDLELLQATALLKVWLPLVRYHGWNGWQTWTPGKLPDSVERERERARWFVRRLHRVQAVFI